MLLNFIGDIVREISKELLSLVLGEEIANCPNYSVHDNILRYCTPDLKVGDDVHQLNLDTLGRLCKEWITRQGYTLKISMYRDSTFIEVCDKRGNGLEGFGDVEIYEATEWVAKEKGLMVKAAEL